MDSCLEQIPSLSEGRGRFSPPPPVVWLDTVSFSGLGQARSLKERTLSLPATGELILGRVVSSSWYPGICVLPRAAWGGSDGQELGEVEEGGADPG